MENVVALVTPFNEDMSVNYSLIDKLIDYHIKRKTDKILLLGTTSEAPTLSKIEKYEIVKRALKRNKKIKFIVGISVNNYNDLLNEIELFDSLDFDEYLIITPFYNKSTNEGLYDYFIKASKLTKKKIIIYDVPSRTNNAIDISVLKRLSKVDNIIGIKEASMDYKRVVEISKLNCDSFKVYCGDDLAIMMFLALGVNNIISVLSNVIPDVVSEIILSYDKGEVRSSLDLFRKYQELIIATFNEVNPVGIKYLMNACGNNVGSLRIPLSKANNVTKEMINKALDGVELN